MVMSVISGNSSNKIAFVVACTKKKRVDPPRQLQFDTLGHADDVNLLAKEWLRKIEDNNALYIAEELYCGPGWVPVLEARSLSQQILGKTSLYVLSAGMGLICSTDLIPAYSATFADGKDQVVARIDSGQSKREIHREWWNALGKLRPKKANFTLEEIQSNDYILVAAGSEYLYSVHDSLIELVRRTNPKRLFIISIGISKGEIDASLQECLLPFDISIEHMLPGARSSINQRVLHWVVKEVIPKVTWERHEVEAFISKVIADCHDIQSTLPKRQIVTLDDSSIKKWIRVQIQRENGITKSKLLRTFRESMSCEQSRFSKLVDIVRSEEQRALAI